MREKLRGKREEDKVRKRNIMESNEIPRIIKMRSEILTIKTFINRKPKSAKYDYDNYEIK